MESILEPLYASPEISDAFEQGRRYERATHTCERKQKVIEKKVFAGYREHPRSRRLKYGIVSKGVLLNPTFNTEVEAGYALRGLMPANKKNLLNVVIDAQVVKLF